MIPIHTPDAATRGPPRGDSAPASNAPLRITPRRSLGSLICQLAESIPSAARRQIDGGFVEEGLLSAADVAASRQAHVDPSFQYRDLTLDAAWGRRHE